MTRNPLYFFLLLILHSAMLRGQNAELNLIRTSFWAPKEDNTSWIVIKKDADGTAISGVTDTKAWVLNTDNTVTVKPVGYASGCHPRVSACFRKTGVSSSCPPTGTNAPALGVPKYYGRGIVVDDANQPINDMKFPEKPLAQTTNLQTYEYPASDMEQVFPEGIIRYYAKFRIRWEWALSPDPGANWQTVGFSENPMYVTRRKPEKENKGAGYQHFITLLHIGCSNANGINGVANEKDMIDKIWMDFAEDRKVYVLGDNVAMRYYGVWSGGNIVYTTSELLLYKDGECNAWTKLFLDILKVQGFTQTDNVIFLNSASQGFFIAKWQQNVVQGSSPDVDYPFKNIRNTPFYLANSYNWIYHEVDYVAPTPAQNNENPVADFGQHVVAGVYYKDDGSGVSKLHLYDSSYGVIYNVITSDNLVPEFNNNISCFYKKIADTYYIQMNNTPQTDVHAKIYNKMTY